jgi:phosphatidylglycerophosphate synthase
MAAEMKSWDGKPLDWRNKATDRFVLRWIKRYLSAPLTRLLVRVPGVGPAMVTVTAAALGTAAGVALALGYAWQAGIVAAAAQILDGVDGQLARLKGRESRRGAFLDSALDRVADGALMLGTLIYLLRAPLPYGWYVPALLAFGAAALISSNLVSYSGARAGELGLTPPPRPTLASKGTRTAVMVVAALATPLWSATPALAVLYLALHPTAAVLLRLLKTAPGRSAPP